MRRVQLVQLVQRSALLDSADADVTLTLSCCETSFTFHVKITYWVLRQIPIFLREDDVKHGTKNRGGILGPQLSALQSYITRQKVSIIRVNALIEEDTPRPTALCSPALYHQTEGKHHTRIYPYRRGILGPQLSALQPYITRQKVSIIRVYIPL